MFRRIELWRILRKPLDLEPAVSHQKIFHPSSLMDPSLIPNENHRPPKMSEKEPQKNDHVPAFDIPDLERKVKPPVSASRRKRERRNDRKPLVTVDMTHNRSLPSRGPRSQEKRDEHEAAFIQKRQMGAKFERFFLSPASVSSSSARWRPRLFPWLAVPASGNSIPILEAPVGGDQKGAKNGKGGVGSKTLSPDRFPLFYSASAT